MEELFSLLDRILASGALQKIVFSRPKDKTVKRAEGRTVSIKGLRNVQIETFYTDGKARHRNLPESAAGAAFCEMCKDYAQINIFTSAGDCEALISSKGKCHMKNRIKGDLTPAEAQSNDKERRYLLDPEKCAPFLSRLGVCSEDGRIYDRMRSKFRQINRFTEILDDAYPCLPQEGELTVYDLCCGKSYLSFAVYYYLTSIRKRNVRMYGADLKKDVIDFCAQTAKDLGFDGMTFTCCDISEFSAPDPDLVVSLHACDIATDLVLAAAIRRDAKVILSTPCCHHEMMRQLDCAPLSFVSDHSMLRQKMCDSLTDALRCKRLEAEGYKVTALELIDPEETPKNLMIKAIKRSRADEEKREKALEEYRKALEFLGVEPYLDKLLKEREEPK